MTDSPTSVAVTDAAAARRFEARVGGSLAGYLEYRRGTEGRVVLVHTEVDPAFAGHGIGSELARFALEQARKRGIRVVPRCPFVQAFLRRHPEYADIVEPAEAPCSHLDQVRDVTPSAAGCEDCLKIGGAWVHLRLCLSCGHVGCCDSSPNRHASAHSRATGHALVRSFEPGEDWLWCYVDEVLLEPGAA